ncbi:MAG: hypothetical protein U0586_07505 [Candidatus Brocadiaceae bacterium]
MNMGLSRNEISQRVNDALIMVDMASYAKKPVDASEFRTEEAGLHCGRPLR